jgi:hypothetical protein
MKTSSSTVNQEDQTSFESREAPTADESNLSIVENRELSLGEMNEFLPIEGRQSSSLEEDGDASVDERTESVPEISAENFDKVTFFSVKLK